MMNGSWALQSRRCRVTYLGLIKMMMMMKGTKLISERLIPIHPMSHCVFITKTYLLMFSEIIAVYSKCHIKHVHTVGRQNTKLWKLKHVAYTVWACSRDVRQHNPKKNSGRKFLRKKALLERRGIDMKKKCGIMPPYCWIWGICAQMHGIGVTIRRKKQGRSWSGKAPKSYIEEIYLVTVPGNFGI
jgi:hypothetical protein